MSPHFSSKDFRDIHDALEEQGWDVAQTSAHCFKAKPPGQGQLVFFTESASPRGRDNVIGQLRRSGFVWPPPMPEAAPSQPRSVSVVPKLLAGPAIVPEVAGQTEDQLYTAMKEARLFASLAEDDYRQAVQKRDAADREVESTTRTKRLADEALAAAKAKFDRAFEAAS